MKRILQMLKLQQSLNDATNGKNWEAGITKNGKLIDWKRCTYLECAELIESYPWKHWKNIHAEPDYANIQIEAVDIWHFIMSQGLQEYKVNHTGSIEALAEEISTLPNFQPFTEALSSTKKDIYAQIAVVEVLMKNIFCDSSTSSLMASFLDVAMQSGLNLETLYKLYVGKNILNQFRQDHGYKEGSYIKIWNGAEDNVTMQQILEKEKEITPEGLYAALEAAYPKG